MKHKYDVETQQWQVMQLRECDWATSDKVLIPDWSKSEVKVKLCSSQDQEDYFLGALHPKLCAAEEAFCDRG